MAHVFTMPSPAEMVAAAAVSRLSNAVMTPAQYAQLHAAWTAAFPAADGGAAPNFDAYAVAVALAMANNGSSPETKYVGAVGGASINALVAHIDVVCTTRRQFLAYFAKVVFNHFVSTRSAPSKWQDFGFTYDTRQVGFDASYAITNNAAYNPYDPADPATPYNTDGLLRALTGAELVVIQANKSVSITRAVNQRMASTTLIEGTATRRRESSGITMPGLPPPS